jgi:hypothetical protein
MKVVPPGSSLLRTYQTAQADLNTIFDHAFPEGATGDANALQGQCARCGETLVVRAVEGEGVSPVTVAPHGEWVNRLQ